MTQVELLNFALGRLGCSPIADLNDDGRPAQILLGSYAVLRDSLLEERDWTFATGRLSIDLDPIPPVASSYVGRYAVPRTVIRVLRAWPGAQVSSLASMSMAERPEEQGLDFQVEAAADGSGGVGKYIMAATTANPLYVKAILRQEDLSLWSPSCVRALGLLLAADNCIAVTENRGQAADLWKFFEDALQKAAANDGRQGASTRIQSNYLKQRRG